MPLHHPSPPPNLASPKPIKRYGVRAGTPRTATPPSPGMFGDPPTGVGGVGGAGEVGGKDAVPAAATATAAAAAAAAAAAVEVAIAPALAALQESLA